MKELINDPKNYLIDVRTADEYAQNFLEGSINIPLDNLSDRIDDCRTMSKTGNLILFCRSGLRSENARNYLMQYGIKNVYNAGGLKDISLLKTNK